MSADIKLIPLTRGLCALVNMEDFASLSEFRWTVYAGRSGFYAGRLEKTGRGARRHINMHREIARAPDELFVDHRNGDPLDNRRANLRICTKSQNNRNRRRVLSASGFKGVYFEKDRGLFRATIGFDGKSIKLGRYNDAISAAHAYDAAAIEYFGEFACTNEALGLLSVRSRTGANFGPLE